MAKIQLGPVFSKKILKPAPNRGLVAENHSMKILKWIQRTGTQPQLDAQALCKGKKAQFGVQSKGQILEWKFKLSADLNPQKLARLIESSGQCARFDCTEVQGKQCSYYLCDDLLILCNTNLQFVGAVPINRNTTAAFLSVTNQNVKTEFAVVRVSHASGILYLKGLASQAHQLVSLINSLI